MGDMQKYQQEFVQNLKKYRYLKKLSQAKLSELCNVSTGTIGNIECGISKPSFDLILTIAEVLEIHPALLFSGNPLQADNSKEIQEHELLVEFYEKLKNNFQNKN